MSRASGAGRHIMRPSYTSRESPGHSRYALLGPFPLRPIPSLAHSPLRSVSAYTAVAPVPRVGYSPNPRRCFERVWMPACGASMRVGLRV